jgi:hypothetical protein
MGYCCVVFDDGTRYCYSSLTEQQCVNFPRGAGTYYETQSQCLVGCNLQPPGGGAGGGNGGGGAGIECFDFVPRSQCTGIFTPNVLCSSNPCDNGGGSEFGICCKNGTCLTSATTSEQCRADCGNWLSTFSYFFTSQNGQYLNDRVTYQFGSDPNDCQFCALGRPFFDFIDSGSCWPVPRFRRVSLSDLNYSNNNTLNNKCCNYVNPDGSYACSDLLFNQFGFEPILTSQTSNTPREGVLELLSCNLTEAATNSIFNLAEQVNLEWVDLGYSAPVRVDCPGLCCKCVAGQRLCIGAASVGNLCGETARLCPEGYDYGVFDCDGTGPISGGGEGGIDPGPPPGNLVCLDDYCNTNPYYACSDCPTTSLVDSTVKSVKMYLNSTDFVCVDVACGSCSEYELCEES